MSNTKELRRLARQDAGATRETAVTLNQAADALDAARTRITELEGAMHAQTHMQNEQLNKHRDIEILALPEHIVASSDIVDDLCDHFYGELCKMQALVKRHEDALEWLAAKDYTLIKNAYHKDSRGYSLSVARVDWKYVSPRASTPLAAIEAAIEAAKEEK